ncbi:leucine-rich repeat-containing protein 2 isoform X1 [Carettochelys insculpta]|uniref:leucine-rich repeat-containing protein 2 isoform X1 n=1 Tax=Carettochelys insculpta TaxID=44489 RepID=UPI003EBDA576
MGHQVIIFDISAVRGFWETQVKKYKAVQKKEKERLAKSSLEKIKQEWDFVLECRKKGIPQSAYLKSGFVDTTVKLKDKTEKNSQLSKKGALPDGTDKERNKFIFQLSGEHWTELPDSLKEQTHLKEWHIHKTQIQTIPAFIALFQELKVLEVSNNQITHLPVEIAAPWEGPESASEASVVPESPPGPSLQASPSAEDRLAPRRARRRTQHHHPTVMDPQLLALHRRQLEVAEQRLLVEQCHLHLQERALAWHQEAWGAYMDTFNRLVDYLAPHATPATAASTLSAPPATPPASLLVAVPSAVAPPPTTEGCSAEGDLRPAETCRTYLPVRPAPSQPRTGLRPRRGSRLPTPVPDYRGVGHRTWAPPVYSLDLFICARRLPSLILPPPCK